MSEKIYGQFDLETIEKLADIVNAKDLGEITIIDGEREITIKGKKCPPPAPVPMAVPAQAAVSASAPAQAESAAPAAVSGKQVKAPIVGTFYAAPSPKDKPFVTVGQSVKKGDVIFIIESMKVMSEVTSEYDGVVKEILVSDGDPLEFDQTVMIIG